MDDDIIVTLKRSNDLLMTFGNDYSDVFLPAIDEIERLRGCRNKILEEAALNAAGFGGSMNDAKNYWAQEISESIRALKEKE